MPGPTWSCAAIERLGGLDILVNSAGRTMTGPLASTTPEDFDAMVRLNVGAAYFCTAAAVPALAESGHGAVVNMTSVHGAGEQPAPRAVRRDARRDHRDDPLARRRAGLERIRVNALGPGVIEVPRYFDDPGYDHGARRQAGPVRAGRAARGCRGGRGRSWRRTRRAS